MPRVQVRPSRFLGALLAYPVMSPNDDRDALTLRLRALAARLDQLDRDLADRAWPSKRFTATVMPTETELEAERAELNAQLRALAAQLSRLNQGGF